MKFVNPYFLFALAALAIPIIIHLFNFRKFRRVYFTNVRFLREVQLETQSKSRLKHLLVLACRLLALAFLVFAFAQPYLPRENMNLRAGQKIVSIWIDNSFSMEAVNKSGTLLDEARKNARDIAMAYTPADRFQLLTNDFEGRHQRLVTREEFLQLLDEVKPSPAVRKLSEVITRQQDVLMSAGNIASGNRQSFLISDFQKTISDVAAIKVDTSLRVRLLPVTAQNRNNVYVDSVWFDSPVRRAGQTEQLHVRLRSRADQDLENIPMRLYINGEARTPSSFSIAANSTADTVIAFTVRETGLQQGLIEINDYPVTFDDRFWFSFDVAKRLQVLSINATAEPGTPQAEGSAFLAALFGNDSAFVYTAAEETRLDYSSLQTQRFIILNSLNTISSGLAVELKRFVDNGGSLFAFPGEEADLQSWNQFLTSIGSNTLGGKDTVRTAVDRINYAHPLYQGVFTRTDQNIDLPVVNDHYRITNAVRTTQTELLRMRSGNVFCAANTAGSGAVYLCAVPLNTAWSNFPRHAVFVPTLYQAALFSQARRPLFYTIGGNSVIDLGEIKAGADQVFHLTEKSRNFDLIPAHSVLNGRTRLDVPQLRESGNYLVMQDKTQLAGAAFNFNRLESDMLPFSADELTEKLSATGLTHFSILNDEGKGITTTLTERDYGIRLWKTCIWLVLGFLLAEILLLRFWRTTPKPVTEQPA
jgi:Aerotolerance regulator N-terminal